MLRCHTGPLPWRGQGSSQSRHGDPDRAISGAARARASNSQLGREADTVVLSLIDQRRRGPSARAESAIRREEPPHPRHVL